MDKNRIVFGLYMEFKECCIDNNYFEEYDQNTNELTKGTNKVLLEKILNYIISR